MILTPAFGKHYETKEELLADWIANVSFVADKPKRYVTRSQMRDNEHITFMYNNETRVLIIIHRTDPRFDTTQE